MTWLYKYIFFLFKNSIIDSIIALNRSSIKAKSQISDIYDFFNFAHNFFFYFTSNIIRYQLSSPITMKPTKYTQLTIN